ncbi:MAG TPA: ABC transporter ATP-binding protein [Syntrophomonas sp.]|nr:ABC transporter ATP-binding protein [Syntrophomonas sp.]
MSTESNRGPRRGPIGPLSKPVDKAKNFKGTFKRLLVYLKPRRFRLLIVLIFAGLSTVFNIFSPKIMGEATTKLFEGVMLKLQHAPGAAVDFHYILNILLILAGLYIASALFSYMQQYLMAGVSQMTVFDMRQDVNKKLARLPLKYFDAHTHGDILSRVINDIDNIATTLQQSLTQLISAIVTLVGVLIMMLTISPWLTLIFAVVLPLSALVTQAAAKRSQNYFASQQKELGLLNGHVEEMYTGHQIVKAFGHEQQSVEIFNSFNEKLYQAGWKAQFVSGLIMPLLSFINNIGYVMVCVAGGIFVTNRLITIGDLQAFIQYSRQFTQPIVQTANIINIIQSTIASAERIFEILDEAEEVPDDVNAKAIAFPEGNVAFTDVKFSYHPDVPLIEDLNIDIKKGQTIAIVGPTGAGKTTLVNLLMRFYEIDGGRITIDGVDIRDIKRGALRSMFGMVLQDTWLFNGTIKDNIAYGRVDAAFDEIVQAARTVHADNFIRTLPEGYDTILNEEASNLSQGQKQLLTIARAVLADPVIMILDEATSSVDTRTETYIQNAMLTLMRKRTSFVIAHRLSTIRNADSILVMNEGKVIEQGTHQELLNKNGFYADLYNSQFSTGSLCRLKV